MLKYKQIWHEIKPIRWLIKFNLTKAKCEIETLNGELTEAYTKVKFLELEVVQANAKVERVSTMKLDDVISSQKSFSKKTGLGYTRESSSVVNISKEVKFMKAKEPVVVAPTMEKAKVEKKDCG